MKGREYREMNDDIYRALVIQTSQFLRTDVWSDIRSRIKKQEENIWTENDTKEIREAVDEKFPPLIKFIEPAVIIGFYVYLANRGGQAFLDKTRTLGAPIQTFNLTNFELLGGLASRQELLIKGIDNTTKNWLASKIVRGKKKKLTDREIANQIRKKIPETYAYRSEAIVRTEMAEIVNSTELEAARRNEATHKSWSIAGANICPICEGNAGEGKRGINDTFSSGHERPPAHPYCKCLLEYLIPPIVGQRWSGE